MVHFAGGGWWWWEEHNLKKIFLRNSFPKSIVAESPFLKFKHGIIKLFSFPDGTSGKESACQCRRHRRRELNPCVGKIPWRRKWQATPVFLPRKSHGQKSLVGHKESDMT